MRTKNGINWLRSSIACVLTAGITLSALGFRASAADTGSSSPGSGETYDAGYVSERISNSYSKVSAKYNLKEYSGEDVRLPMASLLAGSKYLTDQTREYPHADKVLDLTVDDVVEFTVDVPQGGLYQLAFDYLSYDESVLPIEFAMQVDGAYPFYECRNVALNVTWVPKSDTVTDRYGDEMVTVPEKDIKWEERVFFEDSSYRHSTPLALQLKAGQHTFRLEVDSGSFLLGSVLLTAIDHVAGYAGSQPAPGNALITIEGEDYAWTNNSAIHGITEYDTRVYPYEIKNTVLNTLDSDSFGDAGQQVTYSFHVDTAGNYKLALNYRQSDKSDFPVFMDIRVDGEIPSTAFQAYPLDYTSKYNIHTLQDGDSKHLSVYLEPGDHTVSYTISMEPITYILEEVEVIMAGVNDLALEITKVAGTNSDKYRDLDLTRYIPGLEDTLFGYADRLLALEESARVFVDGKNVAAMASLVIAAEQLRSLAENPDEILFRIAELSSSTNSVNQYLANTIDTLMVNSVAIDRLWVYQDDAQLPKHPGFFKSLWMNIVRFFYSFTEQSYSASNSNPDNLQVWVNRSSQYVQVMQKMIDEYFTPKTGIKVDISIMPDQYKLVLANSSGNQPDVATGINYTVPYELAIRGALVDMTRYPDFQKTASVYDPGFFLTGTIGESVYSMPETMNFWVLMYRTDVLDKLGLEVPDTIDDVIDMLPELQQRGLNFYYPTAGMTAMRNFHGTTPLIVQNGGYLYHGTAQNGTALGSEVAVEGFTTLTDLFTVYDMPVDIANFYQHFRNGDLPIGIADYGVYNLLTNAAPELDGSWDISVVPGTLREDGTVDRSTCGCAESTVIFKSEEDREDKAWEFVKWWSSTEVQAEFGQTMQIVYGSEYMWTTANMEAFEQLPIDQDHKEVIREFSKNVVDVARVPGTYMLEREISNAFNSIVVDGADERERIDQAVKTINREIRRKLEEFGYLDADGNTIKDYVIPTIESVREILGRTD